MTTSELDEALISGTISAQYAQFLRNTKWYQHAREHNAAELGYLTLGLAGESGEFTDAFKKIVRECGFNDDTGFTDQMMVPGVRDKLKSELGDALWYLTNICDFLGITIEDLMVSNTVKLYKRIHERGYTHMMENEGAEVKWPFGSLIPPPDLQVDGIDIVKREGESDE